MNGVALKFTPGAAPPAWDRDFILLATRGALKACASSAARYFTCTTAPRAAAAVISKQKVNTGF
jgi:hypothetical protein